MDAMIKHPLGALVEYPETGASTGQSVMHIFHIDPAVFVDPKSDFQYSLGAMGGTHGGLNDVCCDLLRDSEGKPVCCKRVKTSCTVLSFSLPHVPDLTVLYYR